MIIEEEVVEFIFTQDAIFAISKIAIRLGVKYPEADVKRRILRIVGTKDASLALQILTSKEAYAGSDEVVFTTLHGIEVRCPYEVFFGIRNFVIDYFDHPDLGGFRIYNISEMDRRVRELEDALVAE